MLALYDVTMLTNEENIMSTQDDKKDVQGRSWDQITQNGTSSAGSVGVGGTGDSGKLQREGSGQSASRTDDLLDDGPDRARRHRQPDRRRQGEPAGGQGGRKPLSHTNQVRAAQVQRRVSVVCAA
jgi:hypothetical protein